MGVDWFAMVFGFGFVLSFGYWCTNFLVVQRAMAAKNMTAARHTPLVAAVPKMFFPILVIVPGMIAVALTSMPDKSYRIPPPILSEQVYAKRRCRSENRATPDDPATAVKAVTEALGKKMNAEQVAALVKAGQATLDDAQIKQGLYNASPNMITTA